MKDLQSWLMKNMVMVDWGDFAGLKDLDLSELTQLAALVENAKIIALSEHIRANEQASKVEG